MPEPGAAETVGAAINNRDNSPCSASRVSASSIAATTGCAMMCADTRRPRRIRVSSPARMRLSTVPSQSSLKPAAVFRRFSGDMPWPPMN
jgi:hypothetical protein